MVHYMFHFDFEGTMFSMLDTVFEISPIRYQVPLLEPLTLNKPLGLDRAFMVAISIDQQCDPGAFF